MHESYPTTNGLTVQYYDQKPLPDALKAEIALDWRGWLTRQGYTLERKVRVELPPQIVPANSERPAPFELEVYRSRATAVPRRDPEWAVYHPAVIPGTIEETLTLGIKNKEQLDFFLAIRAELVGAAIAIASMKGKERGR